MAQVKCPMCGTLVTYGPAAVPVCPSCGYTGPLPDSAAPPPPGTPAPGLTLGVAIGALVLNLFLPGVGSITGGRVREGVVQMILTLVGLYLVFNLFLRPLAIVLLFAMWVWGLITAIQLLGEAQQRRRAGTGV